MKGSISYGVLVLGLPIVLHSGVVMFFWDYKGNPHKSVGPLLRFRGDAFVISPRQKLAVVPQDVAQQLNLAACGHEIEYYVEVWINKSH